MLVEPAKHITYSIKSTVDNAFVGEKHIPISSLAILLIGREPTGLFEISGKNVISFRLLPSFYRCGEVVKLECCDVIVDPKEILRARLNVNRLALKFVVIVN